ncbi:hypothetical protein [Tepidimonas taiwanensis]|uniref:hypothetical protein n=1 Tax=Tepidimonas taiwanensis TaxID=307486 RepID=UPI0005BD1461|nr:hypothetical protein [Tepidimonas taiwanensis]
MNIHSIALPSELLLRQLLRLPEDDGGAHIHRLPAPHEGRGQLFHRPGQPPALALAPALRPTGAGDPVFLDAITMHPDRRGDLVEPDALRA